MIRRPPRSTLSSSSAASDVYKRQGINAEYGARSDSKMGIKGLTKLISDHAPASITEKELANYFGRTIAIDASMTIYQFMIAVRSGGEQLTNEAGEVTSHLQGVLSRAIRFLELGIKPVFVFDGKPPKAKRGELDKRNELAGAAAEALKDAKEAGNAEEIEKFAKRTVRITKDQVNDVKKLLVMMGCPIVEAPCEAEAQCAELCRGGKVFATATEDADALTFGTPILCRHFTFSEARKMPIMQFLLDDVLTGMDLSKEQFIDLCILCGCDYTSTIRGIGPKKALDLIKSHGTIEKALEKIDKSKYPVPEDFDFAIAREEFTNPEITPSDDVEIKWGAADPDALLKFLVEEKGFAEPRILSAIKRLEACKGKSTQGRLDSFFKIMPKTDEQKRKIADHAHKANKKAKLAASKKKKKK
eukprot:TRINITY_DN26961_c0_g1_i2.p1 TRINITY_DN26961_c0_g1~~TRINITY_DN26961_c0_g1_i2.p1  ORF type:complete len:416 (+),score=144.42 TRINITY_DN26961_c0_g1_i2:66-1313(+)